MPHWISLALCYLSICVAFLLILRMDKKSCTTTAPEDLPVKTEPSPTGPTPRTFQILVGGRGAGKVEHLRLMRERELQDDTEFRSRYRGGLMYDSRPVSDYYSAPSTGGSLSTDEREAAIAEAELKDKTHWDWWVASGGTSDYHLHQSHHWEAEADRLRGWAEQ